MNLDIMADQSRLLNWINSQQFETSININSVKAAESLINYFITSKLYLAGYDLMTSEDKVENITLASSDKKSTQS